MINWNGIWDDNGYIPAKLIENYFDSLVNCFFKILPIKENEEETLAEYTDSLMAELKGVGKLIDGIECDARWLSMLGVLQNIIDNPDYPHKKLKREVYKAINICKRLKLKYGESEEVK